MARQSVLIIWQVNIGMSFFFVHIFTLAEGWVPFRSLPSPIFNVHWHSIRHRSLITLFTHLARNCCLIIDCLRLLLKSILVILFYGSLLSVLTQIQYHSFAVLLNILLKLLVFKELLRLLLVCVVVIVEHHNVFLSFIIVSVFLTPLRFFLQIICLRSGYQLLNLFKIVKLSFLSKHKSLGLLRYRAGWHRNSKGKRSLIAESKPTRRLHFKFDRAGGEA